MLQVLFFSFFFLVLNYLWYRTNLSFLLYWWESFNSFFIEVWADLYFLCLLQGNRRFIDDCTRSGKEKVSRHQSIHIIVLFSHTWGWFKTNFSSRSFRKRTILFTISYQKNYEKLIATFSNVRSDSWRVKKS